MKLIRISLIITTLLLSYSLNAAELSNFEKQKIANEFNDYFKSTDSGSMQTLNKNPWAGKRARQNERTKKILQVSATMDNCKQYSLKQRRQCFVSGNNPASCELSYKARLDHCHNNF